MKPYDHKAKELHVSCGLEIKDLMELSKYVDELYGKNISTSQIIEKIERRAKGDALLLRTLIVMFCINFEIAKELISSLNSLFRIVEYTKAHSFYKKEDENESN